MAATMNVPGIGPVKSTYVYAGGALVAGIVVMAYLRRSSAPAEEDATVEEPAAELPAETGYGAGFDYSGTIGSDYPGSYPDYRYPSYTPPVYSGRPSSNPEWADAVQEALEDRGADGSAVSSAVGRYLARLCLSDTQADLIRQALAAVGEPPQGAYSVSICPPTTTPPPTTNPPPAGGGGTPALKAPVLRIKRIDKQGVSLDWDHVTGAYDWEVHRNGKFFKKENYSQSYVGGMKPNTTNKVTVYAIGQKGNRGPGATITVKTKR